jgi:hypothetical protein
MACDPQLQKHSTSAPGAGLCCSKVGQPGFLAPPAGTILATYTPGSERNFEHIQVQFGPQQKCGTCLIVGSKSPKHPGRPVFKFVPGGPGCPTTSRCCALATG